MLVIVINILIKYTFFFGLIITTLTENLSPQSLTNCRSPLYHSLDLVFPIENLVGYVDYFSNQTDATEFWLPHFLPRDTGKVISLQ